MLPPSSDRRTADHADDVIRGLSDVAGLRVVPDPRLADLTTLRIGGRPRALLECETAHAVTAAVGALDAAGVPVLVLGGGSNLVVAGGDLDMVVVAVRNREIGYREA
ncbi:FAD-binding protein, partial [Dietzia natronolimnaea]|nr:FAD-binding protein [Dietzia natronolimnaea]